MRSTKMNCLVHTLQNVLSHPNSRDSAVWISLFPHTHTIAFALFKSPSSVHSDNHKKKPPSQMPADPIIITQTTYLFFIKQFFKPLDSTLMIAFFC